MAGIGSVKLTDNITLFSVLHVPHLTYNLLSVRQLTRSRQCVALFTDVSCVFQDLSGKTIGTAREFEGLYYMLHPTIESKQVQPAAYSLVSNSSVLDKIMLWHQRLGHPSFPYLKKLYPHLFINKNLDSFNCDICQLAKHTRVPFKSRPYSPSSPFSLIHSDLWGPSRVPNLSATKWFVTFIDDHTRMTWVYLLKEKTDTEQIFKSFHNMIKTQFNAVVKVLRTDNGTEYFNDALGTYLSENGIVHHSSCTNSPQQNGIAERKNRHILETSRSLMFTTNVPKYYWGDSILAATYLLNRMPSKVLSFQTPLQVLLQSYPDTHLFSSKFQTRVFGCVAYVHVHNIGRSKFDPRAVRCIFLGYSSTKKGYRCYDPLKKKLYTSMDVTFHESQSFYPKSSLQGENSGEAQFWEIIPETQSSQSSPQIPEIPESQLSP